MQLDEVVTISVERDEYGTEFTILDRTATFEDVKVYRSDASLFIVQPICADGDNEVLEVSFDQARDLLVVLSKALTD